MKKIALIVCCFIICNYANNQQIWAEDQDSVMNTIEFIPKEFHEVKLGFYENNENICTPYFPNSASKINGIIPS